MTKADFYIGTGISANWIGSIFGDGSVERIPLNILICGNETLYEELAVEFLTERKGAIKTNGDKWPWLWPDSRMTDYSYLFVEELDKVVASHFGGIMFDPILYLKFGNLNEANLGLGKPVFPLDLEEKCPWTESCPNYTKI